MGRALTQVGMLLLGVAWMIIGVLQHDPLCNAVSSVWIVGSLIVGAMPNETDS